MKNNRSINVDANFIARHGISTQRPSDNTLFWRMWDACLDTAHNTLNTRFLQGIRNGDLSPLVYGGFNVLDAYYCFHAAQDYVRAASKADDPTLKAFLQRKYSGYQKYNETFPAQWHIKDASGIVPGETCQRYSEFESRVASTEEAIYCLISMIPCEYLWAWLGKELSSFASERNLYAPWIRGNNDPNGAFAMGNFLEHYCQHHVIDENKAQRLYRQAIEFEYQNFATAT